MTNDTDRRALELLERENAEAELRQEQEAREAEGSRLDNARRRIRENDAVIAAEQARREAGAEAREIARQRYELEERLEGEAMAVNRTLSELESMHQRQGDALRRAGAPLGHDYRLTDLITGWWKDRFGGFNSLTGTPSPHFNSQDRPLPERDTLASPRL